MIIAEVKRVGRSTSYATVRYEVTVTGEDLPGGRRHLVITPEGDVWRGREVYGAARTPAGGVSPAWELARGGDQWAEVNTLISTVVPNLSEIRHLEPDVDDEAETDSHGLRRSSSRADGRGGLTTSVMATLASDREADKLAREAVRAVLGDALAWPEGERFMFKLDDVIGNKIATSIGERLSLRFDGAVPSDGIHDSLWMTFMGSVAWAEVGKYFRDGEVPAGWDPDED